MAKQPLTVTERIERGMSVAPLSRKERFKFAGAGIFVFATALFVAVLLVLFIARLLGLT